MDFYRAVAANDETTATSILDTFFMPYSKIRKRRPGYAISILKAGARLVGQDGGPVSTPLVACSDEVHAMLNELVETAEDTRGGEEGVSLGRSRCGADTE